MFQCAMWLTAAVHCEWVLNHFSHKSHNVKMFVWWNEMQIFYQLLKNLLYLIWFYSFLCFLNKKFKFKWQLIDFVHAFRLSLTVLQYTQIYSVFLLPYESIEQNDL